MNNPFEVIDARLAKIESLLLDLKHQPRSIEVKAQDSEDELLTVQQAAKLLSLTTPTIYGLVSKSKIPVNKKSKRLYFSKKELTDWIKSGRKLTNEEIDEKAEAHLKAYSNRMK